MTTSAIDTLRQRQAAAALEQVKQELDFRQHVAVVLGLDKSPRQRLLDVIRIGDDAVVSLTSLDGKETWWAAVVNDQRPVTYVSTQDEALVHLVALRHDKRNSDAYTYACRVLKVPTQD